MKLAAPTIKPVLEEVEDAGELFVQDELLEGVEAKVCTVATERIIAAETNGCRLHTVDFTGAKLEKLTVKDTIISGGSFVACDASDSGWRSTELANARLGGTVFQMSSLKDVKFIGCKLDMVNFRFAKLTRVVFENCTLIDTDFYSAELTDVVFNGCVIDRLQLSGAKLKKVDVTTSELQGVQGFSSMKGIIISPLQLVSLAPYMASELGIVVEYDEDK